MIRYKMTAISHTSDQYDALLECVKSPTWVPRYDFEERFAGTLMKSLAMAVETNFSPRSLAKLEACFKIVQVIMEKDDAFVLKYFKDIQVHVLVLLLGKLSLSSILIISFCQLTWLVYFQVEDL